MGIDDRLTMYEVCLYHSRADRTLRLLVGRCLEKYKVTMMEWLLLGVVGGGPTEGLNMSSLAKQLDVTMPQVTALTGHLIEQKLVRQKAAKHDRRNRFVLITGKGKNLLEDVQEDIKNAMSDWLAPIPFEQLDAYMTTVEQISQLEPQPADESVPAESEESGVIEGPLAIRVTGEEVQN